MLNVHYCRKLVRIPLKISSGSIKTLTKVLRVAVMMFSGHKQCLRVKGKAAVNPRSHCCISAAVEGMMLKCVPLPLHVLTFAIRLCMNIVYASKRKSKVSNQRCTSVQERSKYLSACI